MARYVHSVLRMGNTDSMMCKAIAAGLVLAATSSAWQVQYDLLGPVFERTRSHIVQVGHEFDGWGVAVAPEWFDREYADYNAWIDEEIGDVQMRGGGAWVSAWMRPLETPGWKHLKVGAYGRWRRFVFAYRNRPGSGPDDFRQDVESWAAGLDAALTFEPFEHVLVEPCVRWGLAHHDIATTGHASDDFGNSDFRYEWDPDLRIGILMGVGW